MSASEPKGPALCAQYLLRASLKLSFEEFVDLLGVGFAAALFHDLADEEAEETIFARAVVG